jgi:zinc D-Ala-D-Ala carboxypeptidase
MPPLNCLYEKIPGAKNFTMHELLRSARAERLGIPNVPDLNSCARLIHITQEIAQPARDALGKIVVSSGFRSPLLNMATPGASLTSAHQFGAALDLQPKKVSAPELALWIVTYCEVWDQVIYERRPGGGEWVHVSLYPPGSPAPNRMQIRRHWPKDGDDYPHINRAQLAAWACARS